MFVWGKVSLPAVFAGIRRRVQRTSVHFLRLQASALGGGRELSSHSQSNMIRFPIWQNISLHKLFHLTLETSQRDKDFCMTTLQISKHGVSEV